MKVIKSFNVQEHIWKLAQLVAKKENRSVSNLLECLIVKEAEKIGLNDYDFTE